MPTAHAHTYSSTSLPTPPAIRAVSMGLHVTLATLRPATARTKEVCGGSERNQTEMSATAASEDIQRPGPNDVLMGRGAPVSEHEGNARLRAIVIDRHADYVDPSKKRQEKHLVALEIIEAVKQEGGRFLRRRMSNDDDDETDKAESSDGWVVVDDQTEIVRKVKQLLRDMAPLARKRRAERHQLRSKASRKQNKVDSTTGQPISGVSPSQQHTATPNLFSAVGLQNPFAMSNPGGLSTSPMLNPTSFPSLNLPSIPPSLFASMLSRAAQTIHNATLLTELERQRHLSALQSALLAQHPTMTSPLVGASFNSAESLSHLLGSSQLSGQINPGISDSSRLAQPALLTNTSGRLADAQALSLSNTSSSGGDLSSSSTREGGSLLGGLPSTLAAARDLAEIRALLQSHGHEPSDRLLWELLKKNTSPEAPPRP